MESSTLVESMKICFACKRCFDEPADRCIEADHPPLADYRNGHSLMVPGYSLDRLLASVTKADTYLARRLDCDRTCLIKVVSTDQQGGEKFLRDAGQAAGVFDARIADIYETGQLAGYEYFVVEEDVAERTLRDHLDEAGTPDLLASIRIVEQIAEALHALHLNGLTHGSVRPENIFLNFDDEGRPDIRIRGIDLGGVAARNIVSNKFLIDSAIDTVRYFAPEQCAGAPACPQTDVYSLGLILFELLAGSPPFDAPKAVALIEMHKTHRAPEVMIDDLELRMLVAHSLSESLQKQPSFRQSSADLFARQMRHIEQLATHVSTPPPAVSIPVVQPKPPGFNTTAAAPARIPIAEPRMFDDEDVTYERSAESSQESDVDPLTQLSETITTNFVLPEEPLHSVGPEPRSEFEQPNIDFSEIALNDALTAAGFGPHQPTAESPGSERSSLAERRHRLKQWKNRSRSTSASHTAAANTSGLNSSPASTYTLFEPPQPAHEVSVPPADTVEEISASEVVTPKLIEWEQPDDVPSIDEIELETATEPAELNPPTRPRENSSGLPSFDAAPKVIKLEQLDDDIPSLEDVFEARLEEEGQGGRFIHLQPEDFNVAAAIQDLFEADTKRSVEVPHSIEAYEARSPEKEPAIEFAPTLLDERKGRRKPEPMPQFTSVFAETGETVTPSRSIPYRSLSIGVGLMIIATLLGLGGEPIWQYLNAPSMSEPVAAAAAPADKAPIPVRFERPTSDGLPTLDSEPPNTFQGPVFDVPAQSASRRTDAVPKPRRAVKNGVTSESTPLRQADSTPFSPSTIVITYGTGNVERSESPRKSAPARSSKPADERSSGATRPRIVTLPRNR